MKITKQTRLEEINEAEIFIQAKGHFIGGGAAYFEGEAGKVTLEQLQVQHPTWYCEDMIYGLNRFKQVAEHERQYVFSVYSDTETADNPELSQVQLFYFPAVEKKTDFYAILLAGGAYGGVCTMVESMPVAAKLSELGITCFCLNYRTAKQETFSDGLMPKPLDDLAAAWRFVKAHEKEFGIHAENYIVGGFSAGGHAVGMWGTKSHGFRKYDIPKPKLLMLDYPLVSLETLGEPYRTSMFTGMLGIGYTEEKVREYNIHQNVDEDYPPVYLVQSMDDDTVDPINADYMEEALKTANVAHCIERIKIGGHGFGLGTATECAGWPERAIQFMKENEDPSSILTPLEGD